VQAEIDKLLAANQAELALSKMREAVTLNVDDILVSTDNWNLICWNGSLNGKAALVLSACDEAVTHAPEDGNVHDSRGLARALTGDSQGAIEDFQAFIAWTDNEEQKAQRQRWITALQNGENPFTAEELEGVREQ
jgi:hypothetical protein